MSGRRGVSKDNSREVTKPETIVQLGTSPFFRSKNTETDYRKYMEAPGFFP
jgi:hypothetical protein